MTLADANDMAAPGAIRGHDKWLAAMLRAMSRYSFGFALCSRSVFW